MNCYHRTYMLGWGRCSCQLCIFSSAHHWASIDLLTSWKVDRIAELEQRYGHTLHHGKTIREVVNLGVPFIDANSQWIDHAIGKFDQPIFIEEWTLPKGAGEGHACGSV